MSDSSGSQSPGSAEDEGLETDQDQDEESTECEEIAEEGRRLCRAIAIMLDQLKKGKRYPYKLCPLGVRARKVQFDNNRDIGHAYLLLKHLGQILYRNQKMKEWLCSALQYYNVGREPSNTDIKSAILLLTNAAAQYIENPEDKWHAHVRKAFPGPVFETSFCLATTSSLIATTSSQQRLLGVDITADRDGEILDPDLCQCSHSLSFKGRCWCGHITD